MVEIDILSEEVVVDSIGTMEMKRIKDKKQINQGLWFINLGINEHMKTLFKKDKDLASKIRKMDLYDVYKQVKNRRIRDEYLTTAYLGFSASLDYFFNEEDIFGRIKSKEKFNEVCETIFTGHGKSLERLSSNDEIARFQKMKQNMTGGGDITFDSMYSSLWIELGTEPANLTMYAFTELFHRLAVFKRHTQATIFATITKKASGIPSWYENRRTYSSSKAISREELDKMSIGKVKIGGK